MFLGVNSIGVVHDKLGDGTEITWSSKQLPLRKAKALVTSRRKLIADLTAEFGFYTDKL